MTRSLLRVAALALVCAGGLQAAEPAKEAKTYNSLTLAEWAREIGNPRHRYNLYQVARYFGEEAAPYTPAFAKLLDSDDMVTRRFAAMAIGEIGPRAIASKDALLQCLAARDRRLRMNSAAALARVAPTDSTVIKSLVVAMNQAIDRCKKTPGNSAELHDNQTTRSGTTAHRPHPKTELMRIIDSLGLCGPHAEAAVARLVRLSNDPAFDLATRVRVLGALARVEPKEQEHVTRVIGRLRDKNSDVRHAAIDALTRVNPRRVDQSLVQITPLLKDAHDVTRWKAAALVGQIDPTNKSALTILESALKNGFDTRELVTRTLAQMKDVPDSVIVLLTFQEKSRNPFVRRNAKRALDQIRADKK